MSKVGLEERLDYLYPVEKRGEDWPEIRKPYDERIDYEVGIILKMGFGLLPYCHGLHPVGKNNGVPVGPGRGSGAGSLVAYSLKLLILILFVTIYFSNVS